jgi:hypothetical protein
MRTLFYMGRNSENQSGVSWKIWRVAVKGRVVEISWGPAKLVRRKPVLVYEQGRKYKCPSEAEAKRFAEQRLQAKLAKGYERTPRGWGP